MNIDRHKVVKEIESELDCGMKVFVHKITYEIVSLPDFENEYFDSDDLWEEQKQELETNSKNYFEIEKWDTTFSFDLMSSFAENIVENEFLKEKLLNILKKSKPFRNFKNLIDNEEEYREKWFEYKNGQQFIYVEKILADHNL
jgi:hypothetical protein